MMKTFAELEQTTDVDPQDVIDTLQDYAESGAAIKGDVVKGIVRRTQFSAEQMKELLAAAQAGAGKHVQMSDNVPFQHVPPEVNMAAKRQGAWMEVLRYGESAKIEKQDAEMREAGEYQAVANLAELLLRQTEQQ